MIAIGQSACRRKCWLAVICVAAAVSATATAQEGAAGRRIYQEQLRVRLDEQLPEVTEEGVDVGGWLSFALFNYDDPEGRKRTLRQYELRGWAMATFRGVHRFYVRGLVGYDDWNTDDNPNGDKGDDFVEPTVERAWYEFNLGRLLKNRTGRDPECSLRFRVGRDYVDIGNAFVMAMNLDMVKLDLSLGEWDLMAFLGKTITHTQNPVDDSERVTDHQDRCMFGVQIAYNGIERHRPFVYFLNNQDNTEPWSSDPLQRYEYTSRYVGVGSEGNLLIPNLRYQAELVGEWGKVASDGPGAGRSNIYALGLDVLLQYLFDAPTHPKLTVEYLFGTGDADRRLSTNSTVGGNLSGTRDNAFNAFGFRDTGLAFSPRVSNLHVYTAELSCKPLEKIELFKKMEIGTKVFFYHKATGSGPISDSTATHDAQWVGWEWDAYCDWRLTSDVTWTIRYGAFQPGSAFEDKECRQFLYTAITLSF